MGRHMIGYEVQKVLAAIDWFENTHPDSQIELEGFGEGALVAFYAAACDPRIDGATVHGYFGSREKISSEPIYRNVYGLLREFGDAQLASLIAPGKLIIVPGQNPGVTNQKGDVPAFDAAAAREEIRGLPEEIQKNISLLAAAPAAGKAVPLQDGRESFSSKRRHDRLFRQLENHVQSLVRHSNPLTRAVLSVSSGTQTPTRQMVDRPTASHA